MVHVAMQPVTSLRPVFHYVDRNGIPRSPRMERVAARLEEPQLLLPSAVAGAVLDDLVRACGTEEVGLRVEQSSKLEQVGPFGRRLCRVPTVAAGFGLMVSQRHNSSQCRSSPSGARSSSSLPEAALRYWTPQACWICAIFASSLRL